LIKNRKDLSERLEAVMSLFPSLSNRLKEDAGKLSGGEKQQLALARALMLRPKLLLMDEPSLGLSPKLVSTAFETIRRVNQELNTTIVIVEQKVHEVLNISHRVYALRMGRWCFKGHPSSCREGIG